MINFFKIDFEKHCQKPWTFKTYDDCKKFLAKHDIEYNIEYRPTSNTFMGFIKYRKTNLSRLIGDNKYIFQIYNNKNTAIIHINNIGAVFYNKLRNMQHMQKLLNPKPSIIKQIKYYIRNKFKTNYEFIKISEQEIDNFNIFE